MKRTRPTGFTVIEITVAMLVASLILVTLYATVVSIVTADNEIDVHLSTTRVGPVLLQLMTKDLEGCYVPNYDGTFFIGEDSGGQKTSKDSIHFVTTADSIIATEDGFHAPYIECGYVLAQGRNKGFYTLYRREEFYLEEDPVKGGKYIELYDYVKRLNIEYYDPEREQWLDRWEIKGVFREHTAPTPVADAGKDGEEEEESGEGGENNEEETEGTEETGAATNTQEEIDPLQAAEDEIKFPVAIRVTLEIGIPPLAEDFQEEEVEMRVFQTLITIPASYALLLEDDKQGGFQPGGSSGSTGK